MDKKSNFWFSLCLILALLLIIIFISTSGNKKISKVSLIDILLFILIFTLIALGIVVDEISTKKYLIREEEERIIRWREDPRLYPLLFQVIRS
jgi:hypothetical protein